ncbi:Uncharacterized protein SCG7086_BX_00080 [Chlamydiales bacterium SCGC AG-110-P3]|nr:Uncharacterized protein SCG7086_BX_00080 [Chlamydiales bacterium SCGC AG-110-P3]
MDNLEDFKIPEEAMDRLKDPEVLKQYVAQGKTFQQIIGYSAETMERFYQGAYTLFQKCEYAQSADAFIFLTTLNPYVHNYWLGLGLAEIKNEEFDAALIALGMAGMIDAENPMSSFHSANCYNQLGSYETAVDMLDTTIERCGDKEEYAGLKEDAMQARTRIKGMAK